MKLLMGFLLNIQFFTSIPVRRSLPMDEACMKRALGVMPLAGLLQGVLWAGLLYTMLNMTPVSALAAAFFLWLAGIAITGGLHLDGWADASDAYFSYRDREKRLAIMSDPRIGAFGVLSLVVLLAARFFFIYETVLYIKPEAYVWIASIPFFGKAVTGLLIAFVPAAKAEGLAYYFRKFAGSWLAWLYGAYLAVFLAVLILLGGSAGGVVLLAAASSAFLFAGRRQAKKLFGGITGDVLGAASEGTELMLWMIVWLLHFSAMG